jgi:phage terminase large subunit-like protein
MRSEPCVLGLDLSSKVDITALVALWPPAFTPNRKWLVLPWFFCPEHAGERRDKANRERYEQWIREGWMVQTEGHKIDYREIRRQIQWLHAHFGVHEVAHDPWAAGQLTTELEDEDGLVIPEVPQTIKRLSDPMKELEAIILEGDLEHGDNPILSWMASNLACYTDPSGNIRPDKARSLEKIDGMTALITGFTRGLAMNEAGGDPQCYKL